MAELTSLQIAIIEGSMPTARALAERAVAEGADPVGLFKRELIPAMEIVGQKMQAEEYYIPEVLLSARAMRAVVEILKPLLAGSAGSQTIGRVVMGTVLGDQHDIGKNLVCLMLEGAGFEVTDLGTNVPAEKFVAAVTATNAQLLGLSALLTTTMLQMRVVLRALTEAGLRDQVKVLIGGAPVTQRFANEVGADGFARDAAGAALLAKTLVGVAARP